MMSQGEIILGVMGVIFIVAELWQVWALRRTVDRLVNNPEAAGIILSNAIHGFMSQLTEDSKDGEIRRNNFFGFMQIIGRNIMAGATGTNPAEPAKPVKLKGTAKILEPIINNPGFQQIAVDYIKNKFMPKAVGKAGDSLLEGWD